MTADVTPDETPVTTLPSVRGTPVAVTPCMNPKCDRAGTVRLEVFGQLVGYACRVCSDSVDNYQQRTQT